ncbi:glycine radical domain-containing protein [Escherichia coli]
MGSRTPLNRSCGAGRRKSSTSDRPCRPADGYFHHEADVEGGQHLDVNVMNRECCWMPSAPEKYPNLTIRVSGYAVRFNALTREQRQDVISHLPRRSDAGGCIKKIIETG